MSYCATDPAKLDDLAFRLLYFQSEYKSVLDEVNRCASADPNIWLSLGAKLSTPPSIPDPSFDLLQLELMGSRRDTEEWVQSQAHPRSEGDELGGNWRTDEEIVGEWGVQQPAPVSNAPSSPLFAGQFDTFDYGLPSTIDPTLLNLQSIASSSSGPSLDQYFNSPPLPHNHFGSFGSPFTSPTDSLALAFNDARNFQRDAVCESPEVSPLDSGANFSPKRVVEEGNIWDSGTFPGKGAALFHPLASSTSSTSPIPSPHNRKAVSIPGTRANNSSGAPLARSSSSTGRSRRGSSGSFARFSPLSSHTRAPSLDAASAIPLRPESTSGISAAIATLTLATSISPPDSPLLRFTLVPRANSTTTKRAPRTMTVNPAAFFEKNSGHLFAVHSQAKCKVDVGDSALTALWLDVNSPSTSPLWRVTYGGEQYTRSMYYEDAANHSSYVLITESGDSWNLAFSQFGTQITPLFPVAFRSTCNPLATPIFTFIHFLPNDIVVSPSQPLGSIHWWRLQDCPSRHEKMPGTGAWTARNDDETVEKRRPARIVAHFARCPLKNSEGDFWSLGKLARAVVTTLPTHGS